VVRGEADLIESPRLRSLPCGLRRRLLAVLDGLSAPAPVEDVLRRPVRWKRAAEVLHPCEQFARSSEGREGLRRAAGDGRLVGGGERRGHHGGGARRSPPADHRHPSRRRTRRRGAADAPERRERPDGNGASADEPAAEAAAEKRVLLALVHGGVAPERACGEVYLLLPGPVDGCGLTPLAAGDLVAAPG
jgi:hypothetical protein